VREVSRTRSRPGNRDSIGHSRSLSATEVSDSPSGEGDWVGLPRETSRYAMSLSRLAISAVERAREDVDGEAAICSLSCESFVRSAGRLACVKLRNVRYRIRECQSTSERDEEEKQTNMRKNTSGRSNRF